MVMIMHESGHQKDFPEYDCSFEAIARKVLSKAFKTKLHLCSKLDCTPEDIEYFIETYPCFKLSVEQGLIEGEVNYRNLVSTASLLNSNIVNTKLLTLMGENCYGIKGEPDTVVNVTQNNSNAPVSEQDLKDRGIPVPQIGMEDLEDDYLQT
jgi:hypothetical protein